MQAIAERKFLPPQGLGARVEQLESSGMSEEDKTITLATMGDRLRKARQASGMTIAEAAGVAGVHEGTLQRWEVGDLEPKVLKLATLADAYGKSLDWFLSREPEALLAPGSIIINKDIEAGVVLRVGGGRVETFVDWIPDRTTAYFRVPENFEIARGGTETETRIKLFERELDKRLPVSVYDAWERIYDTLTELKMQFDGKK